MHLLRDDQLGPVISNALRVLLVALQTCHEDVTATGLTQLQYHFPAHGNAQLIIHRDLHLHLNSVYIWWGNRRVLLPLDPLILAMTRSRLAVSVHMRSSQFDTSCQHAIFRANDVSHEQKGTWLIAKMITGFCLSQCR